MNEDKILVPLDDYEEKAKDQRTVEIIRDMVIREGDVAVKHAVRIARNHGRAMEEIGGERE